MELVDFTEKQARSIELAREHRITIYDGSIRSGKTVNSLFAWLDFLETEEPTGLLLISGFSKETIKANILEPLLEILGEDLITWNDNEAIILGYKHAIVGGKTVLAEGRIRGRTLSGALVDEVTLVHEGFWTQLYGRISNPRVRIIGTTNPGGPNHWLLKDFLERARTLIDRHGVEHDRAETTYTDEDGVQVYLDKNGKELLDLARFVYTLDDNPALDKAFVRSVKIGLTGVFYRRNILGEWCIAEGAVYSMFDPLVGGPHVIRDEDLPRYDNGVVSLRGWQMGIDHGTVNPFHAVIQGFDEWGRVFACREWRYSSKENNGRQMTDAEYSAALSTWVQAGADGLFLPGSMSLAMMDLYPDPAAPSFRTQLIRDGHGYGLSVDKAVSAGINDVGSLIQAECYFTSDMCEYLIKERSSYSWNQKAQEAGIDEPLKVDDHGMDAERYPIRMSRTKWERALIAGSRGRLPALPRKRALEAVA